MDKLIGINLAHCRSDWSAVPGIAVAKGEALGVSARERLACCTTRLVAHLLRDASIVLYLVKGQMFTGSVGGDKRII